MTEIRTFPGEVRFLEADVVVAGMYEDERPPQGLAGQVDWYLFGQLTDLLESGRFQGKSGEFALIATQGRIAAPKFMLVGLGAKGKGREERFRELLPAVAERLRNLKPHTVALELVGAAEAGLGPEKAARMMVESFDRRFGPSAADRVLIIPADEGQQEIIERVLG